MNTIARVESIPIETRDMTDAEFLTGAMGRPATIAGVLRLPRTDAAPMRCVVLLHGSGGPMAYVDAWAQRLHALGWATLLVDSFSGRGITSVRDDQGALGRLAAVMDAYRALERLRRHDTIDPERIVLMGFSRGGQAALYAALRRFQRIHLRGRPGFAAHISFYPNCCTRYLEDEDLADAPVRIHHGDADDFNPIGPCRAYVERLRARGLDVELASYPGAHHVFDWQGFATPAWNPHAQTMRGVQVVEQRPGELIDERTGETFSYASPHIARGATAAYDAKAAQAARVAVESFLARWSGRAVPAANR